MASGSDKFRSREDAAQAVRDEEEAYLTTVLERIPERLQEIRDELVVLPENEYVTGHARRMQERGLRQEYDSLLALGNKAPYFGRFSVQERIDTGFNPEEVFYVGLPPIRGHDNDNLVWDYRQELCALYFRYGRPEPEVVSYRAPGGLYHVRFLGKRQISIVQRQLVSVHDGEGNRLDDASDRLKRVDEPPQQEGDRWVDPVLTELLADKRATGAMVPIVATIQAEQDILIRSSADVLIIQGPAGSGKTIVALQRVAQLLFNQRQSHQNMLRSRSSTAFASIPNTRGMMVYSPNSIFSDYISRVLPDLNEDAIQQVIFEEELRRTLRQRLASASAAIRKATGAKAPTWQIEKRGDRYEAIMNGDLTESENAVSAYKASYEMVDLLRNFATKVSEEFGATVFTSDILLSGYYSSDADAKEGVFFSRQAMLDLYSLAISRGNSAAKAYDMVIATIDDNHLNYATRQFSPASAIAKLGIAVSRFKQNARLAATDMLQSITHLYRAFWEDRIAASEADSIQAKAAHQTIASLDSNTIQCDDILPMLLLDGFMNGFVGTLHGIAHAIIDEAQDYSVLHFEYLRHVLPSDCGLTIVGDISQGIDTSLSLSSWDYLVHVFGSRATVQHLTHSYRSSREITRFAASILKGSSTIEGIRSSGHLPVLIQIPAGKSSAAEIDIISQQCQALKAKGRTYVGVICRTRVEAKKLARSLQKTILNVSVFTDMAEPLPTASEVVVTPLYLAKGLEFDAVIIVGVDAATYSSEIDRKTLYTACTRPLHELIMLSVGDPSPFFDADLPDARALYEVIHADEPDLVTPRATSPRQRNTAR